MDQQQSSPAWLQDNFGAFAAHAPYADFIKLKADFNGVSPNATLRATGQILPPALSLPYAGCLPLWTGTLKPMGVTAHGKPQIIAVSKFT